VIWYLLASRTSLTTFLDARTGDESTSAGQSTEPATEAEASGNSKPKPKRARHSRRHMAKSEPSSRNPDGNDGAQDSDITAIGSGEGQPVLSNTVVV